MKTKHLVLTSLAALLNLLTMNAGTRYVKQGGAGTGDGSSWTDAAATILPTSLMAGDIIFIAAGEYEITASLSINRDNVSIYGACAGTESNVNDLAAVPDTTNLKTIIKYTGAANATGRVINATNANFLIQGCRITGGNLSSGNGGGILIASGTVRYCTVSGNKAPSGGGIRVNGSDAIISTIENCIVSGNEAITTSGGGIQTNKNTKVINCLIKNNKSASGGGGILMSGGNSEIDRCIIDGNEVASDHGGGVYLNTGRITNSLIVNNRGSGSSSSGGIRIQGTNTSYIYNCTIVGNESGSGGGGAIHSQNSTNGVIRNCIAWNNKKNASGTLSDDNLTSNTKEFTFYSIFPDAGTNSKNNLDADPLFSNAAAGDYTLTSSSPARGAGDVSVGLTIDLAGTPRGTETIDIGAYEYKSLLQKETTPEAAINYIDETLNSLTAGAYAIGGANYIVDETGIIGINASWFGTTVNIVKKGDGTTTSDSNAQLLEIPARPESPNVTGGIIKIGGTTVAMEYASTEGGKWTDCSDESTTVEEGEYLVRLKAVEAERFAGETTTVSVQSENTTGNAAFRYLSEFAMFRYLPDSREIVVENVAGKAIIVYNIAGLCIVKNGTSPRISTSGWAKGVYIVRAGNETGKIIVK
jgi:hypothetical protein